MNKHLNFKIVGLFLIVLISTLSYKKSSATHLLGADIAVKCISTDTYQATLSIYRDCNGTYLGGTQGLRIFSACSGLDVNLNVQRLSVTDVSQVCPTQQSSCSGGSGSLGIEKHIYQTTYTLPAGTNCNVRFSWRLLARNVSLTTVNNPNNTRLYTETNVDNSLTICNNSPKFTLDPIIYFPVGQLASLNYFIDDVDGDSLSYSLVSALDNTGIPITYVPGFSGALPLGAGVPITIDQNTGTITFTPNSIAQTVFAIKIEEYRSGVLIGSVTRDINVVIIATTNVPPTISGFDGGSQNDTVVCPNQLFTTQILLTGTSVSSIEGVVSNNIPGLSFSQQVVNTDTTILSITWFPTTANTGNNVFYLVAKGDQCPVSLISSKGFKVIVSPLPPIVSTSLLSNSTCATSLDGSAFFSTFPALTPGYSVSWVDVNNNVVGTSDTLQNVGVGLYVVQITLGVGLCTVTDNVLISHSNSTTSTAAFTMDSQIGCSTPDTVTFTDQSIINDISCGTVWVWDFGDGNTSTTQNPSNIYTSAGVFPVSLTITDCSVSCPTTVWDTVKISVSTVDFSATPLTGCAPLTSIFADASSSSVGIASWNWNFGDGNTATTQNPSNIYLTTGSYTVTLAVTDNNGCITSPEIKTNYINSYSSSTGTDTQVACDTMVWIDGNVYSSSNNTATFTLVNAAGCDSVVTLDLTINNSITSIDTQVACDSYSWIDGNTYTSSNNTATQNFTNAAGCDSILTLNLTINNSTTSSDLQVACDSYLWIDGNTYTSNNNSATQTLTTAAGCDSVVTLDLTINNSNTGIDTQATCIFYNWIDGNTYTASNNTATHTLTNAAGCDSVVTLNLTISLSVNTTDVQTACDSYLWIDGNTYTSNNNTATQTLTAAAGCDSIVTLDLTINNSSANSDVQVACDSYSWIDGNTYTSSNNTATFTLTNTAGCDSVVTLDLTINNSSASTDTQVACDTLVWIDGNVYSSSNNTATFTLTNTAGCDSVVTLDLTINNSSASTDTQVVCDTLVWIDGNAYSSSNNTATFTLTNTAGCDSVVTLDLTINNSSASTDTQVACDTLVWIDGNVYSSSNNTATFTLTNTAGCDSVVTLDLTINNSSASTDTQVVCDTLVWIDGNAYSSSNNSATFTLTNTAGCDSVVTLDLTINNSSASTDTQVACDTLVWIDGNVYSSSNNTATFTLTNTAGCDSVVTLDLTINNSSASTDTQVVCDTLVWIDGNTYTSSNNTATFTLINTAGCDSVVTLDLTINNSSASTDTQVACDTLVWIDGNVYSSSNNTATFTLTNTAGCDSVVTLDLTINNSSASTDTQVVCDTLVWIDGNTYTSSNNTATFTLINTAGCDSVVTLDLTINNSNGSVDNQMACNSYTWIDGNTYTASINTATFTLTNTAGCDSVVTLNLTIINSSTGIDTHETCISYNWIDGNTYTASNNTATFTLTNAAGCDSVVTLNLTISININTTDTQVACDSLTWIDGITYFISIVGPQDTLIAVAGCDSIVHLDLTIGTAITGIDTLFSCDSILWIDGNTYSTNNNLATFMLTSALGCDSIVTLDLTIGAVDITVIQTNDTIMASQSGATYQWIDCSNGNIALAGDTNQTYVVTTPGDYAVIITDGNCSDTSACIFVTLTGVESLKANNELKIYPNPTSGNAYISLKGYGEFEISITDLTGKVLYYKNKINLTKEELPISDFAKGIYLVKIKSDSQHQVIKLIKQ